MFFATSDILFMPWLVQYFCCGINDLGEFGFRRIDEAISIHQQVTRLARRELNEDVAEKELELVRKINEEFDDNADDLRLSLAEAVNSRWTERVTPALPPAVKQAVEAAGQ